MFCTELSRNVNIASKVVNIVVDFRVSIRYFCIIN